MGCKIIRTARPNLGGILQAQLGIAVRIILQPTRLGYPVISSNTHLVDHACGDPPSLHTSLGLEVNQLMDQAVTIFKHLRTSILRKSLSNPIYRSPFKTSQDLMMANLSPPMRRQISFPPTIFSSNLTNPAPHCMVSGSVSVFDVSHDLSSRLWTLPTLKVGKHTRGLVQVIWSWAAAGMISTSYLPINMSSTCLSFHSSFCPYALSVG